jgi:alkanesulfonate monooxygenase SsuD/methylene tetrahydromethanopterin reductase-like flavin-dependent oxidoreductase (luciferase family)
MEAIEVIRKLFTGKVVKYQGEHIRLESARLYTMPDTPPPIYVATAGPSRAAGPASSATASSPSAPLTRR